MLNFGTIINFKRNIVMKKLILVALLAAGLNGFAQEADKKEGKE